MNSIKEYLLWMAVLYGLVLLLNLAITPPAKAETGNPPMGCLVDFDCGAEFQWTCIKQNDGRGYCVRRQDWYNDDMNDGGGYERDLEQLDDVWNIDED